VAFTKIEPIQAGHEIDAFTCGEPELDEWLQVRALDNESRGFSRTFVTCLEGSLTVVGYYCLATGSVSRASYVAHDDSEFMPNPVPCILIGRLAVVSTQQRHGLGLALLRDAVARSVAVSNDVGVWAVFADAKNGGAARMYEEYDFVSMDNKRPRRYIFVLSRLRNR
jgi:GNAT superfamily N-acetyltransferase